MYFKQTSILMLLILVLLGICAECDGKKWRAHLKKKTNSPKISATFRTVPPKRKPMAKHHHSAPHKRNPKMNYYHPLPTSWPTHSLPSTYYMPTHYPRWRSYLTAPTKSSALRKMDLSAPFMSMPFGSYSTPMRRSDEFDISTSGLTSTTTPLVDMSAFNAAIADGFFETELPHTTSSGEFLQPEISLGGWTPVDYKSFMADADFSLLNDQMGLNRRADMDGLMFSNPFEGHLL